jgi:hypothetical protein
LIQVLVVTFTTSDPPPTLPYHKRRLGGSARVLGAELGYLRRLVLDGDWRGAEAFAVGDDENDDEDGDENEFQKKGTLPSTQTPSKHTAGRRRFWKPWMAVSPWMGLLGQAETAQK